MMQMVTFLNNYLTSLTANEEGQGLVEYALIIALVSIVLIGALGTLATGIGGVFGSIAGSL